MKTRLCLVIALIVVTSSAVLGPAAAEHNPIETKTLTSFDGTSIVITVFKPEGASATSPVPMILDSHGWAGSRRTSVDSTVRRFFDAGMGVISIDQRGHNESGGEANVHDPDFEGKDNLMILDYVATLDWVARDRDASGNPIADDPVVGAIGGSYGGGYQYLLALMDTAARGARGTRLDALAPEITWYDLPEALAPQGVVRTVWTSALYAVGAQMVPQYVHEAFAYGVATGQWPDGTVPGTFNIDAEFTQHSPRHWSDQGIKVDIPALMRQGTTDTLFNLNQGLHNFHKVLTDDARARSLFVSYNGGHVLPNAFPGGMATGSDACSNDWAALRVEFFKRAFAGEDPSTLLPAKYNLTTADNSCLRLAELGPYQNYEVDPQDLGGWGTPAGPAPTVQHIELASGPLTVAGIPKLDGSLYAGAVDARAFFALSVGTDITDAKVVQHNMMPLRSFMPAMGTDFEIELPGIAVEVPAGKKLFLTISPMSDMSAGHSSRNPGMIVITDMRVKVPLVR